MKNASALLQERDQAAPWPRVKERLGVAAWTSFLGACGETGIFFSLVDPRLFVCQDSLPSWLSNRTAAYGTGFFFFWICAFAASALTAYMLDSSRGAPTPVESLHR
jgi:hypothetical protein